MLGAIIGDMIGSVYEFHPVACDWREFPLFTPRSRFTDDTVMTFAVADALGKKEFAENPHDAMIDSMHKFGRKWPKAGYGGRFAAWLKTRSREPYNSYGNGSAMRVSPAAYAATGLAEAERLAKISAEVTHNHPEGIKGAQAAAAAIFLAREGKAKDDIRAYVSGKYGYDLNRTLEEIRRTYRFDVSCQGTVPEALIAFFESSDFEEAVRKAVWLRGDADTLAAITGSVAEAFYGGAPKDLATQTLRRLDPELRDCYENWKKRVNI